MSVCVCVHLIGGEGAEEVNIGQTLRKTPRTLIKPLLPQQKPEETDAVWRLFPQAAISSKTLKKSCGRNF